MNSSNRPTQISSWKSLGYHTRRGKRRRNHCPDRGNTRAAFSPPSVAPAMQRHAPMNYERGVAVRGRPESRRAVYPEGKGGGEAAICGSSHACSACVYIAADRRRASHYCNSHSPGVPQPPPLPAALPDFAQPLQISCSCSCFVCVLR
jgi:hypothetical protein